MFDSEEHIIELEKRIRSLQEELDDAHTSKRRRLPSAEESAAEHGQPLEVLSDSELPSPGDDTIRASFEAEAEANRGDGDGGSYTLKTPKGAMRFFGRCLLPGCRFSGRTKGGADSFQGHPLSSQLLLLRGQVGWKARRGTMCGVMSPRGTVADGGWPTGTLEFSKMTTKPNVPIHYHRRVSYYS